MISQESVHVCIIILQLRICAIHGAKATKKSDPPGTFCLIMLQPDHLKQNVPGGTDF